MLPDKKYILKLSIFSVLFLFGDNSYAATVIPSSVDAGRLINEDKVTPPIKEKPDINIPMPDSLSEIPEAAKKVHFVLHNIQIEGATVYKNDEFSKFYNEYLETKVSLSIAWEIANKITKKYRDSGYFLSKAYVPEQKVKDGKIIIKVYEGKITDVELPKALEKSSIATSYAKKLLASNPANIYKVEAFILSINDLPGFPSTAVFFKDEKNPDGVKVLVKPATDTKTSYGTISYDNSSSRYTGINEVKGAYTTVLAPMNETTISGLSSIPTNKSSYGSIAHNIAIAPNLKLGLSLSNVKTYPGYTLTDYNINSAATSTSTSLTYQIIRQRLENLSAKISFDTINSNSNIFYSPLVRDHIRTLRASLNYEKADSFRGKNTMELKYNKGLNTMDASQDGDTYISRSGAKPNYSSVNLTLSRLQTINDKFQIMLYNDNQYTSNTLYSAEQFGYGGPQYGRAYDFSEITGDKGSKIGAELRYNGLPQFKETSFQPYTFYDVGKVKNNYIANSSISAASAGLGIRFGTEKNQSGSIGIAWPLTKKTSEPIYGHNHSSPRYMFQFSQGF